MSAKTQSGRSRSRRITFTVAAVILVVVLSELLAFVGLSVANRSWISPADLKSRRLQAASDRSGIFENNGGEITEEWYPQHVIHPYMGYVLDSRFHNQRRRETGGDDAIAYGFGLSEPGLFHSPDDDGMILAITGGSVAHNFARNMTGHLRASLARELGIDGQKIVVLNLALPGFKQPQQLTTLSYLLSVGVHLDVMVNLDGYNEITLPALENVPHGVAASYPRGWHLRVGDFDVQHRLAVAELAMLAQKRHRMAQRFDRWPMSSSFVAGAVWSIFDSRMARKVAELETWLADAAQDSDPGFVATGPARNYTGRAAMIEDLAMLWQRSSELMDALCDGAGIAYLHFLQPNQYLPGSKPIGPEEREIAIRENTQYGSLIRDGYPALLQRGGALRKRGVRFNDLSMLFESTPEPVYIDSCCHLNELGETMVADAVIDAIVDSYAAQ